jgi:hypothetical protein
LGIKKETDKNSPSFPMKIGFFVNRKTCQFIYI